MRRRRAAAAADDIDETARREFADRLGHLLWSLVVFAERIRQTRIRMSADVALGDLRKRINVCAQFRRAERAIESDR